jgi:cell division protein FtsB
MSQKGSFIPALGKQAGRALVAMLVVFYIAALLAVIVQGWRVQIQVRALRQEIEALKQERDALVELLQDAKTDSHAEQVAREELKMSRPEEKVFAPVQVTGSPLAKPATPTPTSGGAELSWASRWIEWLKGFLTKRGD